MKKVIAALLAICMFLPALNNFVVFAAIDDDIVGITASANEEFADIGDYGDDMWISNKSLSAVPHTIEAWVKLKADDKTNNIIYGNYDGGLTVGYFNFGTKSGNPRLNIMDDRGNQYDIIFSEVDARTGQWEHIAVTLDKETGIVSCYLNGDLKEVKYVYPDIDPNTIDRPFFVAGDGRRLNTSYYKNPIAGITVYSDVRTSEEIKADMEGADIYDANLLAAYDLSNAQGKDVDDLSSNNVDLTYTSMWLSEEEMAQVRAEKSGDYAYSFAVIGDIQCTTKDNPDNLAPLYQWIADNKESKNIEYVIGLGDITDGGSDTEWEDAKNAMSILDGVVDYSLVRGNHDLYDDPSHMDQYFANDPAYTTQFDSYGGYYENGSVNNTWRTLTVGQTDWLLLNLDMGVPDPVIYWAKEIIESHPNHKVIISTHAYLGSNGEHIDNIDKYATSKYGEDLNEGEEIWDKLVSQYANIEMVLSGHIYYDDIVMTQRKGVHGNTVTELLINCQGPDRTLKGLGMIAMFYFNQDGTKVDVEYYSAVHDLYFKKTNQITFDTEAQGDGVIEYTQNEPFDGTWEMPDGEGTKSSPYKIENAHHLVWMSEKISNTTDGIPSFDGVYFEQTADIDLNGQHIRSIGYEYISDTDMAAFGGIYDGNGYSIKNGTISSYKCNNKFTRQYGYGLFGAIYGATIKNVVLDNVTIVGRGVTGAIVGIAAAPQTGETVTVNTTETGTDTKIESDVPYDYNKIYNCQVKDTCKFATLPGNSVSLSGIGYDDLERAGMVGGIAGMVYGTTINYCTCDAEFSVSRNFTHTGGIAASAGLNSIIDHCVFSGGIALVDNELGQTASIGGILGLTSSNYNTSSGDTYYEIMGDVKISNCYNSGYFKHTPDQALVKNTHWGGIIGFAGWLWRGDLYATDTRPTTEDSPNYIIENCYNLYEYKVEAVNADSTVLWTGGIIGKALTTADSTAATFWLKDCYSVKVDARDDGKGVGTNEYRNENKLSVYGFLGAEPILDKDENSTVGTLSSEEILLKTNSIDAEILEVRNASEGGDYDEPDEGLAEDFTKAYTNDTIGSDALLVTTIAANASAGQRILQDWDGQPYMFYAGVNAFASVDDAIVYAYLNNIDTPDIIVASVDEGASLVIDRPANIYAPNYNVKPYIGGDNFIATKDYDKPWTDNEIYMNNQVKVKDIIIGKHTTGGTVGVYGFTFTGIINDTARPQNINATKITLKNLLKNGTDAPDRAYLYQPTNSNTKLNSSASQKDELNIVNLYIKKSHTRGRLIGEYTPAYTTFDGLFCDALTSGFNADTTYVKQNAADTIFTIKNSNLRNWSKEGVAASDTGIMQFSAKNAVPIGDTERRELVFDNNIMTDFVCRYGANGRAYVLGWYAAAFSGLTFTNNYVNISTNDICTSDEYKDTAAFFYTLSMPEDCTDLAGYDTITVKNNKMIGVSGKLNVDSNDNFANFDFDVADNYFAEDWTEDFTNTVGSPVIVNENHLDGGQTVYYLDSAMTMRSNVIYEYSFLELDGKCEYDTASKQLSYKITEDDKRVIFSDNSSEVQGTQTPVVYKAEISFADIIINDYSNIMKLSYSENFADIADTLIITSDVPFEYPLVLELEVSSPDGTAESEIWKFIVSDELMWDTDRTELNKAIETAENMSSEDYTKLSYLELTNALEYAYNLSENATQSMIDLAADKLNNAIKALVSKSLYNQALADAESIDTEGFCENKVLEFNEIINNAKAEIDNAKSDQDVAAIVENLKKASEVLKVCSFTDYTYNNDADCLNDGTQTARCDYGCGKLNTITAPDTALGHDWDDGKVTTPATCQTEGVKTYTCKRNPEHTKTEAIPVDPNAHEWGKYEYNNDATIEADGTETAKCKYCDATDTRTAEGTKIDIIDSSKQFKDVEKGKWYKDYIDYVSTFKLMVGMSQTEFEPSTTLTRAMFVQILANLSGVDTTNSDVQTKFEDVPENKWYTAAIKWASENGIIYGMTPTQFMPSEPIQRQQICEMLVRYANRFGIKLTTDIDKKAFSDDAEILDYAKEAVYACQQAGIIVGMDETTFAPKAYATRAQIATILTKFHQKYIIN